MYIVVRHDFTLEAFCMTAFIYFVAVYYFIINVYMCVHVFFFLYTDS